MNCACCNSAKISQRLIESSEYYCCNNCGFLFIKGNESNESIDSLKDHYQHIDPHKRVSNSKKFFYTNVLDHLSSLVKCGGKKILDVGCGYGYFLDMASCRGWDPNGVEVVQDAANRCSEKLKHGKVFNGKLREINLPERSFDAITLWDVIAIFDDPYDDIKECSRLLKKGGIIGIRTRNVLFQSFAYRLFNLIRQIAIRSHLKEPYVFNRFCFSSRSINALLTKVGFVNIEIFNSPLTSGDPYEHMGLKFPIKFTKYFLSIVSKIVFWISNGRMLIGPSLLIWAKKA
jgi:2-polyprenyl-3-methyl-5-hydroxy-6-metoxy-1,4-benzoquinol methylase